MIIFYTNHCPVCKILQTAMNSKGIEYQQIDDESIYIPIAEENNIMSMPFAKINDMIVTTKKLKEYIMEVDANVGNV